LAEKISTHQSSPEQQAARGELSEAVRRLMDDFESKLEDDRARAVWREHLATTGEAVALSALGARYGVSKQRMGQIAEKLRAQFRERVIAELGADIHMSWQRDD
jgi:DNA-directed RNA polymerase sigma subunit (sigma70/sigma32)